MEQRNNCCGQTRVNIGINATNPFATQDGSADVPTVSTQLTMRDRLGVWKVRWGIGRKSYMIEPGLYKVGSPNENSHVLVTANYKLTFDMVRKELAGLDVWILVLDTEGINVWCAAGKGTFGTEELIDRIGKTNLKRILKHRKLILPQLGAPGVAAQLVEVNSGFKVIYGPVYAKDIRAFIEKGLRVTDEMRRVGFSFGKRLALIPMELIPSFKLIPFMLLSAMIFSFIESGSITAAMPRYMIGFLGTLIFGAVLFQIFLPFLPFKSFAMNGWLMGFIWVALLKAFLSLTMVEGLIFLLLLPPIVAFLGLNFTGVTTFTSLSGVTKEIKYAIPSMIASVAIGAVINVIYLMLQK